MQPAELRTAERRLARFLGAFARLLKRAGGQLNVLKVVKLAYLAERRALVESGRPITFDRFVSMPHGPVVSATLNLINDEPDPRSLGYWNQFISERVGHDVARRADPGVGALSRFELSVIDGVYDDFGHMDRFALRDLTHALPEYRDPEGSSLPIHIRDVLEAEGYSEDEVLEVALRLQHESDIAVALSG